MVLEVGYEHLVKYFKLALWLVDGGELAHRIILDIDKPVSLSDLTVIDDAIADAVREAYDWTSREKEVEDDPPVVPPMIDCDWEEESGKRTGAITSICRVRGAGMDFAIKTTIKYRKRKKGVMLTRITIEYIE